MEPRGSSPGQFLRHNHAVKEINMTSVAEASNVVRTLGKSISFAPTVCSATVSLAVVESTNNNCRK